MLIISGLEETIASHGDMFAFNAVKRAEHRTVVEQLVGHVDSLIVIEHSAATGEKVAQDIVQRQEIHPGGRRRISIDGVGLKALFITDPGVPVDR